MHFALRRARLTLVALLALTLHTAPFTLHTSAQRPPAQPNAAEILHKMQKLNVLGSVLYIVAHPDDENTRLITWLANGKKVRTGNLSLTRGDGGQNLIGPELGDALGIIRTQELMEARRIDGGEQFFTRAVDFGFSKNAAESFEKWGKQEVLSDVVRVIRTFRPDVIITRFPPTREAGHGHHEASAILAEEAFDLAGDPKAFPEQLEQGLEVWQPRRLFFNGSTWWKKDLADIAKNDPDWFSVDVGGYDPLLGLSYTEIAGRSRSMHKSQGFGAAETRGESLEYLKLIKGDRPKTEDIFEGIDMTWGAIDAPAIALMIDSIIDTFDPMHPESSLPRLYRLRGRDAPLPSADSISNLRAKGDTARLTVYLRSLEQMRNSHPLSVRPDKVQAVESLVMACAGIVFEGLCSSPIIADSSSLVLSNVLRTSAQGILFSGVTLIADPFAFPQLDPTQLNQNRTHLDTIPLQPRIVASLADPHYSLDTEYLRASGVTSEFLATNHTNNLLFRYTYTAEGQYSFQGIARPCYKWIDRVQGERIRPVSFAPVVSITPDRSVHIASGGPQTINATIEALTDNVSGYLQIVRPKGWLAQGNAIAVDIEKRGDRKTVSIELTPSKEAESGMSFFLFSGPKGESSSTLHEIDYPHIMPQVYYTPAEVKLVPLDVKTTAKNVGYIKGAGDDVPQAIEQLGATVDMIEPSTATLESITKYDAIVVGIRAYNNNHALKQFNPTLMKYVENGGTVVVQYTTRTNDMVLPDSLIGPYPFKLTRDRVTVEEAPPTFLAKDHALLNTPNKITSADFDGWVQERGLYFCGSLDPHYTPLIAWNDPGEQPLNGGLITCDYGKGRYVYTGISFFRQLPAGVPGAYRLFANLISKR